MRKRFVCASIVSLAATSASAATYNVSNLTDPVSYTHLTLPTIYSV